MGLFSVACVCLPEFVSVSFSYSHPPLLLYLIHSHSITYNLSPSLISHSPAFTLSTTITFSLLPAHLPSLHQQTKQTPLHLAAQEGQLEVCDTLLQLGADTNATNDAGQKPVHVAAMNNNSEVVKLFLKTSPELVTTADKVSQSVSEGVQDLCLVWVNMVILLGEVVILFIYILCLSSSYS